MKLRQCVSPISILFVVLLTMGIASPRASALTGNELLNFCKDLETPTQETFYCLGFFQGVGDVLRTFADNLGANCPPTDATAKQAALVARKNMIEHPENLHLTAVALVLASFVKAWPNDCKPPE